MRRRKVPYTIHRFRASFATWAQEQGYPKDAREFSLAHVEGSATVASYARSDLLEQRREIMQAWAKVVAGLPVRFKPIV